LSAKKARVTITNASNSCQFGDCDNLAHKATHGEPLISPTERPDTIHPMTTRSQFRVGAIQMTSGLDVDTNLETAHTLIAAAVEDGAELVALPEFFALIGRQRDDAFQIREQYGQGPIQDFLRDQARRHGIWLLGGSMPMAVEGAPRVRAASLLYDSAGEVVARYDKVHLFDVDVEGDSKRIYQESQGVEPGNQLVVADTPFGRLGLSICYDLRFPELFRGLADTGMDMLMLPSAFTAVTGRVHWEVLLRARAIENLCYVIAPAQWGRHEGGRETYGDSLIIDPWGDVLARLPESVGTLVHEIDLSRLNELRSRFPSLDHTTLEVNWR